MMSEKSCDPPGGAVPPAAAGSPLSLPSHRLLLMRFLLWSLALAAGPGGSSGQCDLRGGPLFSGVRPHQ